MRRLSLPLVALLLTAFVGLSGCKKKDEKKPAPEPKADTDTDGKKADTDTNEPSDPPAGPTIVTREVVYSAGGVEMRGYLATDKSISGKKPGVLVVHEWWGHNDYARKRARMLAGLGYTALAVDMFGDGKQADHPKSAMEFVKAVTADMAVAEARFQAAYKTLIDDPSTKADQVAAIGYCFGGAIVLNMARRGLDLDAVVSFHGSLPTEGEVNKGAFNGKIFVAHGADDAFIKPETVETFKKQMADASYDMEFVAYEGAVHAFTNPGADELGKKHKIGIGYNKAADEASWAKMKDVLAAAFAR